QYISLMKENGIHNEIDTEHLKKTTGVIQTMAQAVIDGNSHYYIVLKGSDEIFDIAVSDNIKIVRYQEGDTITFEYTEGENQIHTVVLIDGEVIKIDSNSNDDFHDSLIDENPSNG